MKTSGNPTISQAHHLLSALAARAWVLELASGFALRVGASETPVVEITYAHSDGGTSIATLDRESLDRLPKENTPLNRP